MDEIIEADNSTDYIRFVEQMLTYYKKKQGTSSASSPDSLGALYSLMEDAEGMRRRCSISSRP
jgi:hypothetical protein